MSNQISQIGTWDELKKVASLEEVKKALYWMEKNREYHKTAYLKRQERNVKIEAYLKEKGISL